MKLSALVKTTYTVHTAFGEQEVALPKGRCKSMPNSPTLTGGHVHAYASVEDTAPKMQRLIRELRSEAFAAAHPVLQAAYAHYAYVCVHPFADGNGRVSRALASVYLYRSPGVPLVVFADQRNEYFDALEAADRGNPEPFIAFIETRALDTIEMVRATLRSKSAPIRANFSQLNQLFTSSASDPEIHAAGVQLATLALAEAKTQLRSMDLPGPLSVTASLQSVYDAPEIPNFEGISEAYIMLHAKVKEPHAARTLRQLTVLGRKQITSSASADLLIASRSDDGLDVWLREVNPVVSETLRLKLGAWIEGQLAELFAEVVVKAQGKQ